MVLGLPGNPVSSYVNTLLFLPVAMAGLLGAAPRIPGNPAPWRLPWPTPTTGPCCTPAGAGGPSLEPLASRGSADLVRLAQADACAWIPEGGLPAGPARYLDLL